MAVQVNDKCIKCGVCVSACPNQALEIIPDEDAVHIHTDKCTECGTCVPTCPVEALALPGTPAEAPAAEDTKTTESEGSGCAGCPGCG